MSSPVGDRSRRPKKPHKMPGCRVVAFFWKRTTNKSPRRAERRAEKLGAVVISVHLEKLADALYKHTQA